MRLRQLSEDVGVVQFGRYRNARHDRKPKVLVFGTWKSPSGKTLICGINLNYLTDEQVNRLNDALPTIAAGTSVKQRYWVGRRLVGDVFADAYRTYDSAAINNISPVKLPKRDPESYTTIRKSPD